MAEVAELLPPSDAEDEEIDDDASAWPLPGSSASAFDPEVRHRHDGSFHLDGRRRLPAAIDADIFVPVFSPQLQHFPSRCPHHQIMSDSDSDSESSYADDQVTLALDLFERRSPPHESSGCGGVDGGNAEEDPFFDPVDPFSFGVLDGAEDMGSDYLDLGLGLGFGSETPNEDEGLDLGGDGFFVTGRSSGGANGQPSSAREGEGLRLVGFGTDSDSDVGEEIASMTGPHSNCGDVPDRMSDDVDLPLWWECLHIEEDRRTQNEDLDWEEVEEGRVVTVMDADNSSIVPEEANSDLDLDEEDEIVQSVEWEVLAMHNLDRNAPVENEDGESYLGEEHNDFAYTAEYEILFEQFADHESFIKGSPPAAKSVIERLPSVVLTKSDVASNNTICAVCKDEISLDEKAKRLPCSHHYHAECILPWLRIRNTCPVCRYELPTDDPNYENWRAWRAGSGGDVQDYPLRYDFEIFPAE